MMIRMNFLIALISTVLIIEGVPVLDTDETLTKSISGMSALKITLHYLLPDFEMRAVAESISNLYKMKSEIDAMNTNGSTELQVVQKLTDVALQQSCEWFINSLNGQFGDISCNEEEMQWLSIKFKLMASIESVRVALSSKSTNNYYNTCDWAKDNIYCNSNDMLPETMRMFFQENNILAYCKPKTC